MNKWLKIAIIIFIIWFMASIAYTLVKHIYLEEQEEKIKLTKIGTTYLDWPKTSIRIELTGKMEEITDVKLKIGNKVENVESFTYTQPNQLNMFTLTVKLTPQQMLEVDKNLDKTQLIITFKYENKAYTSTIKL